MAKRSKSSSEPPIDRINEDVVRETLEYLNFNEQQVGAPSKLWTINKAKEVRVGPYVKPNDYRTLAEALSAFERFREAKPNSLYSILLPKGRHWVDDLSIGQGIFDGLEEIFKRNYNLLRILTPEIEAIFESGSYSVVFNPRTTSIASGAFGFCTGLTSVELSQTTLTSIGEHAFYQCSGLTSVNLSATSVTSIGNYAFFQCSALRALTFPKGLTSIGERAFCECQGLTSVTFLEGWTSIGYGAFQECSGLTSVTFPEGLTNLGERAFFECSGLTSVDLSATNLSSIGESAFAFCTGLTSVTFPEGLLEIEDRAFFECTGLTSVDLSATNLLSIQESAFFGCSGLTSVTFPEGLTNIGHEAFQECTGLTNIELPNGVRLGENAFDSEVRITYTGSSSTSSSFSNSVNLRF